ncbi:hypothetical protein BD413DRAFT_614011 [Trametes elegans]|nr:hypothetical protein BD413DRAFT_614011 [Trametes elegans]
MSHLFSGGDLARAPPELLVAALLEQAPQWLKKSSVESVRTHLLPRGLGLRLKALHWVAKTCQVGKVESLSFPAPHLEHLTIECFTFDGDDLAKPFAIPILFSGHAPRLRKLCLSRLNWVLTNFFASLTHLSISKIYDDIALPFLVGFIPLLGSLEPVRSFQVLQISPSSTLDTLIPLDEHGPTTILANASPTPTLASPKPPASLRLSTGALVHLPLAGIRQFYLSQVSTPICPSPFPEMRAVRAHVQRMTSLERFIEPLRPPLGTLRLRARALAPSLHIVVPSGESDPEPHDDFLAPDTESAKRLGCPRWTRSLYTGRTRTRTTPAS